MSSREGAGTASSDGLLSAIVGYVTDRKAQDVVEMDMRGVVGYTDWFVVCTGTSDRHVKAIHDAVLEGCKRDHGRLPKRVEGATQASWVLMDYLDVVVHIFTAQTRDLYRLEQLWAEAPAKVVVQGG